MSQINLPIKFEQVAIVERTPSGTLILRLRQGANAPLTGFARTTKQADGSFVLEPLEQRIEMAEAIQILGVPYSTLRRMIEMGAVTAWKRSPGRWVLDLASVLDHQVKAASDPEYWDSLKASPETPFQSSLKL